MKKLVIDSFIFIFVSIFLSFYIHINKYDPIDSVVYIKSLTDDAINNGMGFVYKEENNTSYVITNYHVIENSDEIYVYNIEGNNTLASLCYYDIYSDIAIVSFTDDLNIKPVKIDKGDINLGDDIYYFNINNNVIEKGSVLSLNNEISISNSFGISVYDAVAIRADVDRGNSGGPIFNKSDEVIGLLSLMEKEGNKSFFIPMEYVEYIVINLENHTLIRPNLGGVFVDSNNVDVLKDYGIGEVNVEGVVVVDIIENGLLNMKGILKGDVITKVNNKSITSVDELQKNIYSYNIGEEIELEYYRNNDFIIIKFVLEKFNK